MEGIVIKAKSCKPLPQREATKKITAQRPLENNRACARFSKDKVTATLPSARKRQEATGNGTSIDDVANLGSLLAMCYCAHCDLCLACRVCSPGTNGERESELKLG